MAQHENIISGDAWIGLDQFIQRIVFYVQRQRQFKTGSKCINNSHRTLDRDYCDRHHQLFHRYAPTKIETYLKREC